MLDKEDPINVYLGVDLAQFSLDELQSWLSANRGVHSQSELEPYLVHAMVFGYVSLLKQAMKKGKIVEPTILSLQSDYRVADPK